LTWLNVLFLVAALLFALFPVFWLFVSTFKPPWEYTAVPPIWLTDTPTLQNYHNVFYPYRDLLDWPQTPSWRSLIASWIVATAATVISVGVGLLAGIGFARYRAGGNALPLIILSFRMVPAMAVAIPVAIVAGQVGLAGQSLPTLILIYAAYTAPLSAWLLRSYVEQVPPEVEEAAMLDGMSRWQAHFRVTLPLIKSGLITTALFVFILNWAEGAFAIALGSGRWITIPLQLSVKFHSPHVQAALSVLAAAPLVVIGLAIHPHLARSFTFGAITR
jgi:multiple sugar transport system permease protein